MSLTLPTPADSRSVHPVGFAAQLAYFSPADLCAVVDALHLGTTVAGLPRRLVERCVALVLDALVLIEEDDEVAEAWAAATGCEPVWVNSDQPCPDDLEPLHPVWPVYAEGYLRAGLS